MDLVQVVLPIRLTSLVSKRGTKMNLIFADCFSGISGDMLLGALIDLGIEKDWLLSELSSFGAPPFTLEVNKIKRGAIYCTQCRIIPQDSQTVKRGIREI